LATFNLKNIFEYDILSTDIQPDFKIQGQDGYFYINETSIQSNQDLKKNEEQKITVEFEGGKTAQKYQIYFKPSSSLEGAIFETEII